MRGMKKESPAPRHGLEFAAGCVLRVGTAVGFVAVAYHLCVLLYVLFVLQNACGADFGGAVAISDPLREDFPLHFEWVQRITKLPVPNYSAKRYYEEQRPFFEAAAREFELHPYWAENLGRPDQSWPEVVHERVKAMLRQLDVAGRNDYAVEKDRCVMHNFFKANGIPMCRVMHQWRSLDAVHAELDSVVQTADQWPVFLKACHLTQHSSQGTRPISGIEMYREEHESIHAFLDTKWSYRAHDVDRVWEHEGDLITAALAPGFLLQAPMAQPASATPWSVDGRVSIGLVEIRAEVFWGKVYLMHLDATYYFRRDGVVEDYATFTGAVMHQPFAPSGESAERIMWIRDEGYLRCVIDVAERVAHAAHIDYVRVDVFLARGDPSACVVNEISLSSGYPYYGQGVYMAKLWMDPLRARQHKLLNTTRAVHELTSDQTHV